MAKGKTSSSHFCSSQTYNVGKSGREGLEIISGRENMKKHNVWELQKLFNFLWMGEGSRLCDKNNKDEEIGVNLNSPSVLEYPRSLKKKEKRVN